MMNYILVLMFGMCVIGVLYASRNLCEIEDAEEEKFRNDGYIFY